MNPCFELLDRAIVEGRADDLFLSDPAVTHAVMLEEVAAVAGVLRAVGVDAGAPVAVATHDDRAAVVTLLAVLRLGAVAVDESSVEVRDIDGTPHLTWGEDGVAAPNELDWGGVLKAGRTDPAPALHESAATPLAITTPQTAVALRALLT